MRVRVRVVCVIITVRTHTNSRDPEVFSDTKEWTYNWWSPSDSPAINCYHTWPRCFHTHTHLLPFQNHIRAFSSLPNGYMPLSVGPGTRHSQPVACWLAAFCLSWSGWSCSTFWRSNCSQDLSVCSAPWGVVRLCGPIMGVAALTSSAGKMDFPTLCCFWTSGGPLELWRHLRSVWLYCTHEPAVSSSGPLVSHWNDLILVHSSESEFI